jgi:phosphohistidine phosphatase
LTAAGVRFEVVLTSPLLRARQSAEIVAAGCDPKPAIIVIDSLAPGAAHQALQSDLAKHTKRKSLALVGHEPGLGELAARLIGLRQSLPFKKGGICRIDVDDLPPTGLGVLRWLATPKLLRRLRT